MLVNRIIKISRWAVSGLALLLITIYFVRAFDARNMMQLRDEHRIVFEHEYRSDMESDVSWADYIEIETRLADELSNKLTRRNHNPSRLDRYTPNSPANPNSFEKNWNFSYVLRPDTITGSVVLLHGLTDSPYSVRSTAELFYEKGFIAYAPRMPGHGFAVGSLRQARWQDWLSVTRIAMREAAKQREPNQPLILVGYSNGGLLAIRYTIECLKDPALPCPDGLIIISAAIEVTPFALLANLHSLTSWLPYFEQFQWESIVPEIDPFKFTSFPKKPGWEIYKLIKEVHRDLAEIESSDIRFPRTIVFQSLVDDTVGSRAAIQFIKKLPANSHELVIYDVNRNEIVVELMNQQPPDLEAVIREAPFDYSISVITNRDPDTQAVHVLHLNHGNREPEYHDLNLEWPPGVYSLSHIALPFPSDDPIYGRYQSGGKLHLGALAPRGERGVLSLSADYFLRLRYNPFYEYQKNRISGWLDNWR